MIIITPNITIDRVVSVDELVPGAVLRTPTALVSAGGKGVNVARTFAALGSRAHLVGFAAESDGQLLDELFAQEPFNFLRVPLAGHARVATIYREKSGRTTVVNELGPVVVDDDWQCLESAVSAQLASGEHRTLVCSGSLPPGSPVEGYARLTVLAQRAGCGVVVDAARDVLAKALSAAPDFACPNLSEALGILGGNRLDLVAESHPDLPEMACDAARAPCERGAIRAVVTGAAVSDGGNARWVPAPKVDAVNVVGAGDSFVGGLVYSLEHSGDTDRAVDFGVATASAAVELPVAGQVRADRAQWLFDRM